MKAIVVLEKLYNPLSLTYMVESMEMSLGFEWMQKRNLGICIMKCTGVAREPVAIFVYEMLSPIFKKITLLHQLRYTNTNFLSCS